ncbi:transporter substrate-binding domain-containing protein [Cognatishimia sp. F0-27]|uniref:transporter substrate-binding domain-containing protein n=1 Tax=Cognatishimia sp. F0-27 TaxID=2816855 RepID=UPI001D0BF84A|nr:transporter substrate-binding domain-containing protein [Cognatishimia sp. F0-27]MCC1494540.1 transporter substrate-binding domain-containing protein [Cognatishimia sp. F0-27]
MRQDLAGIAAGDVLRVAINTANKALVTSQGGVLCGVCPALAQRLGTGLGLKIEAVIYDGAGKVFADAERDVWDVAFLAIDATRASRVSFTRAYHVIEATYAARASSQIRDAAEADREGVKLLTSTGSAYDMHLRANLRHAQLEHSGTPPESFEEFRAGRCDLVAGVRASLEGAFGGDANFQILSGKITSVSQAMVLPGRDNPLIAALDAFVEQAIAEGFVAHALDNPETGRLV